MILEFRFSFFFSLFSFSLFSPLMFSLFSFVFDLECKDECERGLEVSTDANFSYV